MVAEFQTIVFAQYKHITLCKYQATLNADWSTHALFLAHVLHQVPWILSVSNQIVDFFSDTLKSPWGSALKGCPFCKKDHDFQSEKKTACVVQILVTAPLYFANYLLIWISRW